ncbi:nucleic acid binding protein, putative [Ricinus communis]|uniref:Nucleic acid binding protein, putative n=1 Tax=Ricinus communis TaxID=3988 RepID=B9SEL7_RICCO|nr:nucleic acid binding protein, putative [Ricinus communis]
MAECWAACEGLKLAWNMGYRELIVEVDSKLVAGWLNADQTCMNDCSNLIYACRELIRKDWNVDVRHVFREGNMIADSLANRRLPKVEGLLCCILAQKKLNS